MLPQADFNVCLCLKDRQTQTQTQTHTHSLSLSLSLPLPFPVVSNLYQFKWYFPTYPKAKYDTDSIYSCAHYTLHFSLVILVTSVLLFSHYVMTDSFETPWTVVHHAPLSMGFPRQEFWSGFPFPSSVDLPCSWYSRLCLN